MTLFRSLLLPAFALLAAHNAAAAQTVARTGYIPVVGAAQIFVADKEGLLKAAGIEPKFAVFESGPAMIQALASGTLDIYIAGVAPLAVARSKGVDVKVVAATAINEMTVVAGGKLAPYFKGASRRRRRSGISRRQPASPPVSRRSRRAPCRTPRSSTGSIRS